MNAFQYLGKRKQICKQGIIDKGGTQKRLLHFMSGTHLNLCFLLFLSFRTFEVSVNDAY